MSKKTKTNVKTPTKAVVKAPPTTLPASGPTNAWLEMSNAMDSYVGYSFMKFQKDGQYTVGVEAEEAPLGTKAIAHARQVELGWRKWQDNSPVDRRMYKIADGLVPPSRSELGDMDQSQWEQDNGKRIDPWQFWGAIRIELCGSGETFMFESRSKGGLGAINKIVKVFGQRVRDMNGQDPGRLLIELQADKYKHPNPQYGWIWYPILRRLGWIGPDGKLLSAPGGKDGPPDSAAAADPELDDPIDDLLR